MFELYLFFLIFGGGLLGFSLLSGGDGGDSGDTHLHLDAHSDTGTDGGHSIEITHSADIHTGIQPIGGTDSHAIQHSDGADSVKFFSFRNGIYFSAFFGLTGTALELLAFNFVFTLVSAISMGTFSAYFGYKLMKYLKANESGEMMNIGNLEGKVATVTLPIHIGRKGKIQINFKGQTEEIAAEIADASDRTEFKLREKVLIYEIRNNTAFVIEHEY